VIIQAKNGMGRSVVTLTDPMAIQNVLKYLQVGIFCNGETAKVGSRSFLTIHRRRHVSGEGSYWHITATNQT
jgi:hypothetical protein